jgi:phenylpropionate dioxygenase-like ring-hydroxylating dioxygenase large terminal subunit
MAGALTPELTAHALETVRKDLADAEHLPGEVYTSQAVFEREIERIFRTDWLCVARVEEVANSGDYKAVNVAGEPVVVTRDEAGGLNAFSNLCRHRGVQVAPDGCGNTKRLTCPYHGWAYDLQGCLVGAPMMEKTAGFDKTDVRLHKLHVDTWAGWIFVTFNREPESLDEFVAPLDADVGFLQQERCRMGAKLVSTWDCNWKLVTENLCDPYHFRALHGKSFGARIPIETYRFDLRPRGGISASYDAAPQTPDGDAPLGPMPWLSDQSTGLSVFGFLSPQVTLVGRIDEIHVYTVWPEAVDRTRVELYHLFAEEHFARPDFKDKSNVYTDFLSKVVDEDASVAPQLQQAVASKNFQPGRLSWLEEAVHHQIRYNVERTFAD